MSPSANDPSDAPTTTAPRRGGGAWLRAEITLSDGRRIEIRIPAAVSGSVSSYTPEEGEVPSIVMEDAEGRTRRGRLTQLFGP